MSKDNVPTVGGYYRVKGPIIYHGGTHFLLGCIVRVELVYRRPSIAPFRETHYDVSATVVFPGKNMRPCGSCATMTFHPDELVEMTREEINFLVLKGELNHGGRT